MGLAKGALKVLLKEAARRPYSGRVLTLGRQDIYFTYDVLRDTARACGVPLAIPEQIVLNHKREAAAQGFISDHSLFEVLGFSESGSMDYSDYEGASYVFDLNDSNLPDHLAEAFDVIVDGGTLEHVFHVPNALNNIFKMLKTGGRVIHILPVANYVDHGFYMFSPTLFWEFYQANKFEINTTQVFRHTQRPDLDPWEVCDYLPGCLDPVSFGGLDDGMYSLICVATKQADSTGQAVPQQGKWLADWLAKGGRAAGGLEARPPITAGPDAGATRTETPAAAVAAPSAAATNGLTVSIGPSRIGRIKEMIKGTPWLYRLLLPPVRWIRSWRPSQSQPPPAPALEPASEPLPKKGLGLKVVDRY
ncbi:MAG: class I SAM-dependent methyltransferase [Thermodesulfobacteriota bacterium]